MSTLPVGPNYGGLLSSYPGAANAPTSPGQPTGGLSPGARAALAGIAGPLVALLGSKLSGGAMDFGSGLASFGRGFADYSFQNLQQKRQRDFQMDTQRMEQVHKLVQEEIPKLEPNIMQKFPRLSQLAQKYQQFVSSGSEGGSGLSPKEMESLLADYQMASSDVKQAEAEQSRQQASQSAESELRTRHDVQSRLQEEDITGALGAQEAAPGFEGPPQSQDQLQGNAQRLIAQQELGALARSTPQPVDIGGTTFHMTGAEAGAQQARLERARVAQQRLGISAGQAAALSTYRGQRLAVELQRLGVVRNAVQAGLVAKLMPRMDGDTPEEQIANAVTAVEGQLTGLGSTSPRVTPSKAPAGNSRFQILSVK